MASQAHLHVSQPEEGDSDPTTMSGGSCPPEPGEVPNPFSGLTFFGRDEEPCDETAYLCACGQQEWNSSTVISEELQRSVHHYYASIPPEQIAEEGFCCTRIGPYLEFKQYIPDSDGTTLLECLTIVSDSRYPAPLRAITDSYLLFYIHILHRFTTELHEASRALQSESEARGRLFCKGVEAVFLDPIKIFAKSHLRKRWSAGLARLTQIRLVEAVLESAIQAVWFEILTLREEKQFELLQLAGSNRWTPKEDLQSFVYLRQAICPRYTNLMRFLTQGRFRSERMENLLLGYLEEKSPVNEAVVKGLDIAELKYQMLLGWRLNHRGFEGINYWAEWDRCPKSQQEPDWPLNLTIVQRHYYEYYDLLEVDPELSEIFS